MFPGVSRFMHGAERGGPATRSRARVRPGPAAVVAARAHGRPAPAADGLHLLGMPARLRLDVGPGDVREAGQAGPAQRETADGFVASALPGVHLPGGVADAVVRIGPLAPGGDRRAAHPHVDATTPRPVRATGV